MVNNDMCSQIKGDAGPSRICAGGKSGEGVCDVRVGEICQEKQKECILSAVQCSIVLFLLLWYLPNGFFSTPSYCRKITVVLWFARNTGTKSSSAWASRGQNAPPRSPRFLSTSPSTRSGFTKCSGFTPTWGGTDGCRGGTQLHAWLNGSPQKERERLLGQQIPRSLQRDPWRRNEEKSPYGKRPLWDSVAWNCRLKRKRCF